MRLTLRRLLQVALVFVGAAALLGPTCSGPGPAISVGSLDFQVESLRAQLCALYAERGEVPALAHWDPDCP